MLKRLFEQLITSGFTKAQLLSRLDQVKAYNDYGLVIITDEEYNDIKSIIEAM